MIYFIADTHFGHKNIIKHCDRPFNNVEEMDRTIVSKWNNTVKTNDIVFFLGDWGKQELKSKLKGKIISICGSHDNSKCKKSLILNTDKNKFLLVHNPKDIPLGWSNWTIHGHKHNNDCANFPFINKKYKTVNVSAELIGYKPISITSINKAIANHSIAILESKHMRKADKRHRKASNSLTKIMASRRN